MMSFSNWLEVTTLFKFLDSSTETIEPNEKDPYLDYFLLAGSLKFSPSKNLQNQLSKVLRSGILAQFHRCQKTWMLKTAGLSSNITVGPAHNVSLSQVEMKAFMQQKQKFSLDSSSLLSLSHLPVEYINFIHCGDEDILETSFKPVTEKTLSEEESLDFAIFVKSQDFLDNLDSHVTKIANEIQRRASLDHRLLHNFSNGSTPFYSNSVYILDTLEAEDWQYNDRHIFVASSHLCSSQRVTSEKDKLRNVHLGIVESQRGSNKTIRTVQGDYIYFHYRQNSFSDEVSLCSSKTQGWGCAYRSFQTLYSWFLLQGYVKENVPSISEIQETLFQVGAKKKNIIGSQQWIGSIEVGYSLQKLAGVDFRIITINSGAEVLSQVAEFRSHFETYGTPIMIGGGVLAYTMLGIAIDEDKIQDTQFLILDPHYVGPEDFKKITNPKKGGVWWRASKLFNTKDFYNFCCPIQNSN